jgi:putative ABC transport system ATP-binding protein
LADEPTGALDSKSARQLLENFEFLNQKMSATILGYT